MSNSLSTLSQTREFPFTEENFRFLATLASQKTGIVLAEHKSDMVYGRLARRLRSLGLNDFNQYCNLLQSEKSTEELPHLVNAITTNLTGFFREAHHFSYLKEELKKHTSPRLRIWSAGCSSGMEPYSIAMTVRDALPNIEKQDIKILATDIDTNMLSVGRAGEYGATDVTQVPDTCQLFIELSPKQNRVQMSDKIRKLISFKPLNLLDAWPMKGPFNIIFCRNVVIYFDKPTKQKLFDRMADLMVPNGLLFIGHSENLHGITQRFELIGRTIYRRVA